MPTINKFEDLKIWKLSGNLSNIIYTFTHKELFSKDFGLKDPDRKGSRFGNG